MEAAARRGLTKHKICQISHPTNQSVQNAGTITVIHWHKTNHGSVLSFNVARGEPVTVFFYVNFITALPFCRGGLGAVSKR